MTRWRSVGLIVLLGVSLLAGMPVSADSQQSREVTGLAYPVPVTVDDTVRSQFNETARQYGYEPPAHLAIVHTDSGKTWLVGSSSEIEPGRVTVTGPSVETGSDGGLLLIESIDRKAPTRVPFDELNANPEQYENQYVETTATQTAVAYLYDQEGITSLQTSGSISGGQGMLDLMQPPGRAARYNLFNMTEEGGSSLTDVRAAAGARAIFSGGTPANITYSYGNERFWSDARAEVRLMVLPKDALTAYDGRVFFTTHVEPVPEATVTPAELRANPGQYRGKIVAMEADAIGTSISAQETLLSAAECAPESITVPASPLFCAPVPADVVAHTGAAVTSEAPTKPVPYAGLSNAQQDQPVRLERAHYRMVGRAVDGGQLDGRVNASVGLLVMDRTRQGDLQLRSAARDAAEQLGDRMRDRVRSQLTQSKQEYEAAVQEAEQARQTAFEEVETASDQVETSVATDTPTPTPTPTAVPTASPTPGQRTVNVGFGSSGGSNVTDVSLTVTGVVDSASVNAEAVSATDLPDGGPGGRVVVAEQIEATVPDEQISSATFTIRVDADRLPLNAYRYHDSEWQQVESEVAARSGGKATIRATTPGFSYFALASPSGSGGLGGIPQPHGHLVLSLLGLGVIILAGTQFDRFRGWLNSDGIFSTKGDGDEKIREGPTAEAPAPAFAVAFECDNCNDKWKSSFESGRSSRKMARVWSLTPKTATGIVVPARPAAGRRVYPRSQEHR